MVELDAATSWTPLLAKPRRILVVEDDYLIADLMKGMLEEHGIVVVGPVASLEEGLKLARTEPLNGAVLDVRLGRSIDTFPVAHVLATRSVPFIFVTAYDDSILPPALAGRPVLRKPIGPAALADAMDEQFRD